MRYKPTTVYLDPEDHARLKEEAAARGISLAQLMREISAAHARESAPGYGDKDWDGLIGVASTTGRVRDAERHDEVLGEAMDETDEKKSGRAHPRRPRSGKKSSRG